jgi:hypothetical protein
MVKKITIVAILAALANAAPLGLDLAPNTLPVHSLGRSIGKSTTLITSTEGWSIDVAAAIEVCAVGVASGLVSSDVKAALAAWIAGAGAAFFDAATCSEIQNWCTSTTEIALGASARLAIETALLVESSVSAAGGVVEFLNGVIESGFNKGACACSTISAGKSTFPIDLLIQDIITDDL